MSDVVVYKNRTNVIQVNLGMAVGTDEFTSQIRDGKLITSDLIATWDVEILTAPDDVDGKLKLTLDDSVVVDITQKTGYMDIKRVSGGEPLQVFAAPVKVQFKDVITS